VKLITPYSLLLALLLSGPGLYQAFEDPAVDLTSAVLHFVMAAVLAGVGLSLLSGLISAYSAGHGRRTPLAGAGGDDTETDRTIVMNAEPGSANGGLVTS
jgi:hypothetical protein